MAKKNKPKADRLNEDEKFPLPVYNEKDDIYNREKELPLKNEDDPAKTTLSDKHSSPGDDLDIPGAESDDADEAVGEEDEENNYYSLGGDRHEDLEEDDQ
jgi:hypothetical protein